jgi:hypothetical protein
VKDINRIKLLQFVDRITIKEEQMNAIIPVTPLTSRQLRRMYKQESLRIVEDLELVNATFLFKLFNKDDSRTYDQLFDHFNEEWCKTVDHLAKTHRFTVIAIDRLWFYNCYKPELFIK